MYPHIKLLKRFVIVTKVNFIDSKHTKLLEYGGNTFLILFSKNIILAAISPLNSVAY